MNATASPTGSSAGATWRSPLGGLQHGNDAMLLADAEHTFPSMLAAIDAATDHVHLETYRIQSDETGWRFADALAWPTPATPSRTGTATPCLLSSTA